MITISRKKSKQYEWEVLCTVSLYQIKYGSTEEESMTSASFYSPIIIRIALFMILEETSEQLLYKLPLKFGSRSVCERLWTFCLLKIITWKMWDNSSKMLCVSVSWPAVSVVTPAVSVAHVGTLLPDVDVVQRPLVLLAVVVLDPAETRGTGPEHSQDWVC